MKNAPSVDKNKIGRHLRIQIKNASNSLFIYSKQMDKLMEIFYEVAEGQGFQSIFILENPSLTDDQAREVYKPVKYSAIKQKIFTIDYLEKRLDIHTGDQKELVLTDDLKEERIIILIPGINLLDHNSQLYIVKIPEWNSKISQIALIWEDAKNERLNMSKAATNRASHINFDYDL